MADKKVEIEVTTEAKLEQVQALEDKVNQIKKQKIQLDIDTNTAKLEEVNSKIESTKAKLQELKGKADVDDSEIKKVEQELEALESEKINIELAIETGKLDSAKMEVEELDGTTIDVDVNNISAMEAVDQIGAGFDRLKQGAGEIGQAMGTMLDAAGKQETNFTFLKNAIGDADQAAQKMDQINQIVAKLPGDDTALQGLLSSATAKDASLTADALESMANNATDYFSAMSFYGKSASEAQQDMTNYLLTGNTAELERSPILQGHIDKLKEAGTVEERNAALAEALNQEHWAGMGAADTYNNKLETFNGMLERGKYNLGGMFQEGAKAGMDFVLRLDEATGGFVGMGIAAASLAAPIADTVIGIGQMGQGFRALKDAADWAGITDKLSPLKDALTGVTDTAKKAADALLDAGRKALTAGANAVKSAVMWAAEKAAKIASTAASYALSAAQAVLNFVMSLNPIVLVAIALVALVAALIWAYNNVDWFREMVDNAWASLQQFAGFIMGVLSGAVQWLGDAFNNAGQSLQDAFNGAVEWVMTSLQGLYEYIMTLGGLIPEGVNITGNQIIDSIIAVLTFLATLPVQLSIIFLNMIAQALGFGQNFSQRMFTNAMNAVNGFVQWMATLPSRAYTYLSTFLSRVISWGASIASNFLSAATKSVTNFANQIVQIPSKLGTELSNALNKVNEWAATLPAKFWEAGVNAVKNFLSALGIASPGTMQRMLVWEVTEMGKRVPEESKQLLTNVSRLGENIVDEFGEPTLGVQFDDTANASFTNLTETSTSRLPTINLNLEIGSVDNEDRVQEIVEVIRRELNWNNLTAGRDV